MSDLWDQINGDFSERSSANPLEALSSLGSPQSYDEVWREAPVDISTFCESFLGRTDLTEFHRDFFAAYAGADPLKWDEIYKVLGLCWGQGSGKNFSVTTIVAYTLYRLMLLLSPHKYFGLAEGTWIDIINISFISGDQAQAVFFETLKEVVRQTKDPATGQNWFKQRGVDLRERGVGDLQENVIELPRRVRVRCLPFTSTAFEGADILLAIIDEPSRAVLSPPANQKAHKLLGKIIGNTTTRFGMRGKVVLFSYPEAQDDDLIMQTFGAAGTQFTTRGRRVRSPDEPGVQTTWYGSLGATYEVNPRRKKEDFDEERKTDPEGVQTRIECNPPHSHTGFYRQYPHKIAESFTLPDRDDVITVGVFPLECKVQQGGQLIVRTYTVVRLEQAKGDNHPRVLGGDPGETNDIFSLALARTEVSKNAIELLRVKKRERVYRDYPTGMPGQEDLGEREVERDMELQVVNRRVIIDGLIEIPPLPYQRIDEKTGRTVTATHPISFDSVRDLILALKQHFPRLDTAAFDRWQSSQLIEGLLRAGIMAESWPFSNQQQYALYQQHRALVYNDMVRCLQSARAQKEFEDLQEVIPGRKVDHKPNGSKDSADAIVIATHLALEDAIRRSGCRVFV